MEGIILCDAYYAGIVYSSYTQWNCAQYFSVLIPEIMTPTGFFTFLHLKIHLPAEFTLALRFLYLCFRNVAQVTKMECFRVRAIGCIYTGGVICVWPDNLPLCFVQEEQRKKVRLVFGPSLY